ncbi:MAG: hypothetical protein AAGA47_12045 [Pseudomonadota bacterium]
MSRKRWMTAVIEEAKKAEEVANTLPFARQARQAAREAVAKLERKRANA